MEWSDRDINKRPAREKEGETEGGFFLFFVSQLERGWSRGCRIKELRRRRRRRRKKKNKQKREEGRKGLCMSFIRLSVREEGERDVGKRTVQRPLSRPQKVPQLQLV